MKSPAMIYLSSRQQGKSMLEEQLSEAILDSGGAVVYVTKEGAFVKKRYGKLTSITPMVSRRENWVPIGCMPIYDEPWY